MATGALPTTGCYISIGGVVLHESEWRFRGDPGLIDATAFTDGAYSDRIAGVHDAHVDVSGLWNSVQNIHAAPINVQDGAVLTNVRLGVTAAGPYYYFPIAIVGVVECNAVVRDGLKLAFEMFNKGSYSYAV